jgi:hypothetical protein
MALSPEREDELLIQILRGSVGEFWDLGSWNSPAKPDGQADVANRQIADALDPMKGQPS